MLPGVWLPSCPLHTLTGIPCPFCGITTGCAWLARGHWQEAWQSNILSPILMMATLVLGTYALAIRMVGARTVNLNVGATAQRTFWFLAGAAAGASWIINLHRY